MPLVACRSGLLFNFLEQTILAQLNPTQTRPTLGGGVVEPHLQLENKLKECAEPFGSKREGGRVGEEKERKGYLQTMNSRSYSLPPIKRPLMEKHSISQMTEHSKHHVNSKRNNKWAVHKLEASVLAPAFGLFNRG